MTNLPERPLANADPAARRQAVLAIIFGAAVGGLLVAGFDHFREPFREWLVSEPAETARRAKLTVYLAAAVLSAPMIALAIYLWLLGARVLRARQFPPSGYRVIRDTPVVDGPAAEFRGRAIQVFALCLGLGFALMWIFFWWLAGRLGEGAA